MNTPDSVEMPQIAPASIYSPPRPEDEVAIRQVFELLRAGRWTIAIVAVVVFLLGLLYALVSAPVYEADGLVQVEQDSKQSSISSQLNDISSLLSGTPVETEAELQILKSRMILVPVIQKMNLQIFAAPKYFPFIGPRISRYNQSSQQPVSAPSWLRKYAWGGERIAVSTFQVPDSLVDRIFTLTRTESGYILFSPSGEKVLEGTIGQLVEADTPTGHYGLFVRELVARPNTRFMLVNRSQQSLLGQLGGALQVVEQGKQSGVIRVSYDGATPGFVATVVNNIEDAYLKQNVERRSADAQQSLDFLQKQLPDLKGEVEADQEKLKAYQTSHGSIDVTQETQLVLTQSVDLETKRLELSQQRDEALQRFTAEHPSIRALDEQIKSLEAERAKVDQKSTALPAKQQEILNLTRDLEVNSQLYTEMMNSIQQLEISKAATVGNVRVVDHALEPNAPIKPKVSLILVIALLLGLALGVATVFAQRAMLKGVDDPAEVEARFGLTCYAMIPFAEEQQRLSVAMSRSGSSGNFILAALDKDNSAVESLRSLRTSLHFAMLEAPNNIVLFTGPSPGLGKSFVCANLATVLALTGKRVVLVDADLRKGHLHLFIGVDAKPGIADYVVRDADFNAVIRKTSIPSLDVVTRGTHPPNPSELLLHERFSELLQKLSDAYDYVLIDSPPALAVTDAAIVGRLAGCTLVVLKAAEHPMSEIEETLKRLATAGVNVRGILFNQVGARAGSYGYGNYGYTYYRYER